jgi:aquaporin Z
MKLHWPEYLMEAAGLGLFMLSACVCGAMLEYPDSPVHLVIADPVLRRALMGIAMGLTAIGIIYSPWGKQSGAHINPSVTFTFFRLGKVHPGDALLYVLAHFAGAAAGVMVAAALLGSVLAHPAVSYVVTVPGMAGATAAFVAELVISFGMMTLVLRSTASERLGPYTGVLAGCLVAIYISFEAPWSGMSMNPARTFGSAIIAGRWDAIWIYFTAPPLGMLLAAEVFVRGARVRGVACAKLHHQNPLRCIFCEYGDSALRRDARGNRGQLTTEGREEGSWLRPTSTM